MTETQTADSGPRNLLTIAQFSERWRAWSQASMRAKILDAEPRLDSRGTRIAGNGLAEAGAIIRIGRRVLIDEQRFFFWVAKQQKRRPTS